MKAAILSLLISLSAFAQFSATPPPNLWREVDGVTNCIRGPGFFDYYYPKDGAVFPNGIRPQLAAGWYEFWGTVIEVQPTGIRVSGGSLYYGLGAPETVFFVEGYPYQVEENSRINWQAAKDSGLYTYPTVLGGTSTIHKFVYGRIADAPTLSYKELADIEKKNFETIAKKKSDNAAKALKYNQDLAASGDAYGELRMAERYRDGDGVAKDLRMARELFSKAASQGDKTASKELAELASH